MKQSISQDLLPAVKPLVASEPSSALLIFRSALSVFCASCSFVTGLLSNTAYAAYGADVFIDYAKVTEVSPVYETIEHQVPREECWSEQVQYRPHDERYRNRRHARQQSSTPLILGALIGGALGNELGHHKRNKQVGAVAGAILGGAIGADIRNNHRDDRHSNRHSRHDRGHHEYDVAYRNERRCKTFYDVETEQRLSGYDVQYRYHGHDYSTFTAEHPGKKLQVKVAVQPVH